MKQNLEETYLHKLQIITGIQGKELSEIARKVAEMLPNSQWVEGTANILLVNPDFYAIKTALKLAGGIDFDIEPPLGNEAAISIFPGEQAMISSTQPTNSSRGVFMFDEFPLLLTHDNLKQKLLQVSGVPNTTYRVDGERVFVFAALEQQVKEILRANPSTATSEVTMFALPSAWVSARVAVEQFGIVPVPYKRIEIEGKLAIVHEPFNAVLPPRFDTESDRTEALAQLLLGQVLVGEGEFKFQKQAMSLLVPLDLNSLPIAPEVNFVQLEVRESFDYTRLEGVEYIPEFPLLTKADFDAVKTTEIRWTAINAYVEEQAWENAASVWRIAQNNLDWQLFDDWDYPVPSYGLEDLRELRELYPELAKFSDGALYHLFDSYQFVCCLVNGWEPVRADNFLFYLLGLAATLGQVDEEDTPKIGVFVGYKSLSAPLVEALRAGQDWYKYNTAIYNLVWRIRSAMEFFAQPPSNSGNPIVTINSFLSLTGRKAR